MGYLNFKSLYDKNPITKINVEQTSIHDGFDAILKQLKSIKSGILVFETYPGVDLEVLYQSIIQPLKPKTTICIEDYAKSTGTLNQMLEKNITDDRVFGLYAHHTIKDFYPQDDIYDLQEKINALSGLTVVYGFGASQIAADIYIPVSITRWEIQLRYRKGLANFKANNENEDTLRKYKRGYFVEWRVADRIKEQIYPKSNYIIELNDNTHPVMIHKDSYFAALTQLTKQPFRMVPYFDPGVWGGQWMKEVCNLDLDKPNYAWSFDGVPEENSLKIQTGNHVIHMPAQDLILFKPEELMGSYVHGRFGKQFPIRFDLLDTMGGGNLSLQVHPLTEYIYDKFGMTYTQDESYYILDAAPDGHIYLGFKNHINEQAFKDELIRANRGEDQFDASKYVNQFVAKKHDHFSIPAGTIHCSGKNTMVLEISACVYIFTFKLWDWGRLGLDHKPRPVHLEHGFNVLQFNRNTQWVEKNLINQITPIDKNTELTGLHERQFLKTIRYTFKEPKEIMINGNVLMGNLVEGRRAKIFSKDNAFEPFYVNYAETFIIPAGVNQVYVASENIDETCMMITAQVR